MAEIEIPNNFANLTWIFALAGSSHQFSFSHGLAVLEIGDSGPQNLADEAADAFQTGYGLANVYANWTFVRTHCLRRDGGDLLSADSVVNLPGTASSGSVNTPNLSMIVRKHTIRAGRQYRGRMYWPCLSLLDADVSNVGNIDSTVLGVVAGNVEDFRTAWLAEEHTNSIVLLHAAPKEGATPNPTEVTSWSVEQLCGTQRRRLR
jgi:hypothetical protein